MNLTTQYLVAAYVLGLGLLLAQAISLWAGLNRTKEPGDGEGVRP